MAMHEELGVGHHLLRLILDERAQKGPVGLPLLDHLERHPVGPARRPQELEQRVSVRGELLESRRSFLHILRDLAMEATGESVDFIPEWGRNRMRGMVESRPDWCLSRQRAWGLPIPAFRGPDGEVGTS